MNLNPRSINELESLLTLTHPNQLKQSVIEVFMTFLLDNKSDLPSNFEQLVDDFYYLINFLERIDKDNAIEH